MNETIDYSPILVFVKVLRDHKKGDNLDFATLHNQKCLRSGLHKERGLRPECTSWFAPFRREVVALERILLLVYLRTETFLRAALWMLD